jgi:glycine/serine hydroxymethyltransferase
VIAIDSVGYFIPAPEADVRILLLGLSPKGFTMNRSIPHCRVTTTTHKTLRGQRVLILMGKDFTRKFIGISIKEARMVSSLLDLAVFFPCSNQVVQVMHVNC